MSHTLCSISHLSFKAKFGMPIDPIAMVIEKGLIPESFRSFLQKFKATWDIETLEEKVYKENDENMATITNAIHKIVSLGVSSNLPGFENKFFCRSSSAQEDGEAMMASFLEYLFKMAEKLQELLPDAITNAAEELGEQLQGQMFSKGVCEERTLLNHLKNYCKLSVYGFNSGKIYIVYLKFLFQN